MPGPLAVVRIETPYKLDQYPFPKDRESFLIDLADRTRWNRGGLGPLEAPLPPSAGHPMPKVIVDVTHLSGHHAAADVQRLARKNFWIKVIECYGLGAYKDQHLHGITTLRFRVTPGGKVKSPRVLRSTLPDAEVTACFAEQIEHLALPKAHAGSVVTATVEVNPGDEPMPPPPPLVVPGPGTLDLDAAAQVVAAALPDLRACYLPALAYAPGLWGRLAVRFHVTDRGKLDEAFEVESRFPDEGVARCVLAVARRLSFARPADGEVRFVVPLRFASSPPEAKPADAPAPPVTGRP
jgi:hypothetical protein